MRIETDHGNFTGSILMFDMLKPDVFLGDKPILGGIVSSRYELREKDAAVPRPGKSADIGRTDALEALLNYLRRKPEATALRQKMLSKWCFVTLAITCDEVWWYQWLPHACV